MKKQKEVIEEAVVEVSEAVRTVTPEELTEVRETLGNLEQLKVSMGTLTVNYEFQKDELMKSIVQLDKDYNTLSEKIMTQYGKVTIDLGTGVITDITEE
jgi:metal-responsive CopG/Arc/MetJ family transcriptional regulator